MPQPPRFSPPRTIPPLPVVADEPDSVEARLTALHNKDIETTMEINGIRATTGDLADGLASAIAMIGGLETRLTMQDERITQLAAAGGTSSFWRDLIARYTSRRFLTTIFAMVIAGVGAFGAFAAPVEVWNPATVAGAIGAILTAAAAAIGFNISEGGVDKERAKASKT